MGNGTCNWCGFWNTLSFDNEGRPLCLKCAEEVKNHPARAQEYYQCIDRRDRVAQLLKEGKIPNLYLFADAHLERYYPKIDHYIKRKAIAWAMGWNHEFSDCGWSLARSLGRRYGDRILASYNRLIDKALTTEQ